MRDEIVVEEKMPERPMGDMRVTRTRYLELAAIAKELCEWVELKGVKPKEVCLLKWLADSMIDLG